MLNKLKSKKGLSNKTYNLPTFLIQNGFFKHTETNKDVLINKMRKEKVSLNKNKASLKIQMPLFSYMLTKHHNYSLNQNNLSETDFDKSKEIDEDLELITLCYDEKTDLLKFLKLRDRHKIKVIEDEIDLMVENLNPDNKIQVNNKEFSIFSTFFHRKEQRQIIFRFSKEFIEYLNKDKEAITFVQINDFKDVKSNKTSGVIYLISLSIKNLKKKKFFTRRYLRECLNMFDDNSSKKIDNAFKNLEKNNAVSSTKQYSKTTIKGRVIAFVSYTLNSIKASFNKVEEVVVSVVKTTNTKENDFINRNMKKFGFGEEAYE